jgi:pimeloyl-ACP methyl ester carboxylesterase
MTAPAWTARTFGPIPETWPQRGHWTAEWMTIDEETWFTRITPHGDPALPAIVMLHGLVVSGTYFRPVSHYLDERYTIYIPDLPGYGRSPSRRTWTLASLTTRLAAWMDAHELQKAVIVGNSLGCQMGTLLAKTRPDLVAGLVLVAPTVDPEVRNGLHLMWRGALDVPREKQSLWTVWVPDLIRAGIRRALTALQQTMVDGRDQLARLDEVEQPALLIGGERDPIAPPRWVNDMARRMPNARAIILPGSPHAMNYSSPRDLARAIDTVIQGRVNDTP